MPRVRGSGGRGDRGGASGRECEGLEGTERAKQAMLRLLSVRMRSRWELRERLAGRRYSREAIEVALDDLERVGLVDDAEFARLFVESRLRRRPRSYRLLRQELGSRGVPAEVIEDVIEEQRREIPEVEIARRALGRRMKALKEMPGEEARGRAARFLSGKGFSRATIEELLSGLG